MQRKDQRDYKDLRPPGYETSRRLWTPDRERGDQRPRMLHHIRGVEQKEPEVQFSSRSEWNHTVIERGAQDENEENFAFEEPQMRFK